MNWIAHMHWEGILIGIATFIIIGVFHPIVIKAEYRFGTQCWWVFLILGLIGIGGSVLCNHTVGSALLGVFGFTSLWTIKELFDQKKRVAKGWFPSNPKREEGRR